MSGVNNTIDDVLTGQVVILRQHLQKINQFQPIIEIVFKSIEQGCGKPACNKVKEAGIEYIHTVLNSKQIKKAYNVIQSKIKSYLPKVMAQIGHSLGLQEFYVHNHSISRLMVPLEYVDKTLDYLPGRLHPYSGPHQDSSQQVPLNAINFWIAVGQIKKNNGIEIYPDVWGTTLLHDGLNIHKDIDVGEPLRYDCNPGDIIVFHSSHAHGTAPNTTDQTRVALTSRICVEKPTGINKKVDRIWTKHK